MSSDEVEQMLVNFERAISIELFCERYGVGRTKVYEEIKFGRLKAVKLGSRTLIPVDRAEEWLANLETE